MKTRTITFTRCLSDENGASAGQSHPRKLSRKPPAILARFRNEIARYRTSEVPHFHRLRFVGWVDRDCYQLSVVVRSARSVPQLVDVLQRVLYDEGWVTGDFEFETPRAGGALA